MVLGDIFSQILDGKETPINESIGEYKKPSKIVSILGSLSRYGMHYDDQVYRNMHAIPADKLLQPDDNNALQTMYNGMQWKVKPESEKTFHEKTMDQKRAVLRRLAQQPEIEDILDVITDECVVYDDEEVYICKPFIDNAVIQDLNENALDEVRGAVDTIFYRMYLLADWKNNAWNAFRRWLVDGEVAYEIIYDDLQNPKNVIGIVDIDPATLTRVVENGVQYWVQFKDMIGRERRLLDAQVIYIKYEDSGVVERQSYLERLIRPFNIYRIIEQAQIIWTVTQSSFKTIFTIPVQGMSRARGLQTLNAAMNRYKEDISFNGDTGELQINGKMMLPFTREYFMPENENGRPEMTTLTDQGPSLLDSEQLKWFEGKLYKMSKIPSSRFDRDNPAQWFGTDPSQQLRDEIKFSRFTKRLQYTFGEILLKPLRCQLALQIPDIKNDKRILNAIGLHFNSYNQFVELMEEQVDQTRIEHISSLRDTFTSTDEDGNDVSYFSDEFLIVKYLKMSDADLELNAKYKAKEKINAKNAKGGGNEEGSDDEDNSGGGDSELDDALGLNDEGGDTDGNDEETPEDESDADLDAELSGDVQPESSETTTA
jgi:hypothetical protein